MINKVLSEEEKFLVSNYIKEWETLNQYVTDMDKGYINYLSIFTAIATAGVGVLAAIPNVDVSSLKYCFYLIPLVFVVVFGCLSYQFRITAILHGHLASIEERVNEIIGEDIYLWHSALTETFMHHQNVPNKGMMAPICVFVIFTCVICGIETFTFEHLILNIIYWLLIVCLLFFVWLPFFRNDKFRWKAYDTEKVMQKYEKYKAKEIVKNNCYR